MARHLMAVCVVCLLCAEHLPCKQHFDEILSDPQVLTDKNELSPTRSYTDKNNIPSPELYDVVENNIPNKRKGRTKIHSNQKNSDENIQTNLLRIKRHSHHAHSDADMGVSKVFVHKLFEQFGDGDRLTMNLIGFEKMLSILGLYKLIANETKETEHNSHKTAIDTDITCVFSEELISKVSTSQSNGHNLSKLISNGHASDDLPINSTSSRSQSTEIYSIKENIFLNSKDLWAIYPILIYQLTAQTSSERNGCINGSFLPFDLHHLHHHHHDDAGSEDRTLVWVYASLSILGTSLCGLLGVAVIPCMDKEYYHHILQFLVALAVGTLGGDALLHLLPHAMMTYGENDNPHLNMTLKGLVATLGIIFFFITERVLTMIAEWRKRIEKKEKPSSRVRVMRDPDTASVNIPGTEKLCKHKYSSYPYCYDEIAMDTKDDHHHHNRENGVKCPPSPTVVANHKNHYKNHDHGDYLDTAQSLLAQNNYTISDSYVALRAAKEDGQQQDNNTVSTNIDDGLSENKDKVKEESYTIILREHESKHHGHSHTHGHVHSPPSTLSAVAWMVIMGDGLHNFTDGMAIGAAFSNNIAGGFSTAIAVFCHELPHELGDFAVLLKAGMSARQAVYYNLLSSVLSFLGTILGILIGDTPEASAWIFACAAGMFLYIALVDMMPELTTSHKESFAVSQLCLQVLGILAGVGIMLLIAIFEEDLKLIFTSDHHHG